MHELKVDSILVNKNVFAVEKEEIIDELKRYNKEQCNRIDAKLDKIIEKSGIKKKDKNVSRDDSEQKSKKIQTNDKGDSARTESKGKQKKQNKNESKPRTDDKKVQNT